MHLAQCSRLHHPLISWTFPQWRLGLSWQHLSLLPPQVLGAAASEAGAWPDTVWLTVRHGGWHWLGKRWRAYAEPPFLCHCLCCLTFILPNHLHSAFALHLLCSLHRQAAWRHPSPPSWGLDPAKLCTGLVWAVSLSQGLLPGTEHYL